MKLLPPLALALLFALPAGARPDTFTLEKKPTVGLRTQVVERRSSKLQIRFKNRGTAAGTVEHTTLVQRYKQEVRKVQPEILIRDYELSQRTKQGKGTPDVKELTSVHGRRVRVVGLALQPEGKGFLIGKRDREALRFDRLAEALLPPQKVVRLRESWSIAGPALARSLFGDKVAAGGQDCEAKVTLTRVKQVKGRGVATLKAKVRIKIRRTEQIPGLQLELKGELKWDLEENVLLEAGFAGPVTYTLKNSKLGQESEVTARGPARWSYAAELLASRAPRDKLSRKRGEPPPPGTRVLVCSLNPAHRVELKKLPNCPICGKPYDKDFHCGSKTHGWAWQYCPHDGAPLEPETGAK